MRNLKRALSLAVASIMLLGMMVVGAGAASFPDVDDSHNVEAIEVLKAVKVFVGDEDGNLNPDENISRNEMAVILAKLLIGPDADDYAFGSLPFTDVPDWAQKYVACCYDNGIVVGRGNGIYDGTSTVTGQEAAAMVLRILGYTGLEGTGAAWAQPVVAKANGIGLFDGVASSATAPLIRDQVAQLALNALEATMVEPDSSASSITTPEGFTMTTGVKYEDSLTSDPKIGGAFGDGPVDGGSKYTVELGEKLYKGDLEKNSATDDLGRPATLWSYDGEDIVIASKSPWRTLVINPDDGATYEGVLTSNKYFDLDAANLDVDNYYLNGDKVADDLGLDPATANLDAGDVVELFRDSDNKVETVVVTRYEVARITKVDTNVSNADAKDGVSCYVTLKELDGTSIETYNDSDINGFAASTYVEDTVLAVALNDDGEEIVDSYVALTAEGQVSTFKTNSSGSVSKAVTLGGTKYNTVPSMERPANFDYNDSNYIAYMTRDKYILGIEGIDAVDLGDVYYVTGVYFTVAANGSLSFYAQVVDMEGVVDEIQIEGSSYVDIATAAADDPNEFVAVGEFYTFTDKDSGMPSQDFTPDSGTPSTHTPKSNNGKYTAEEYDDAAADPDYHVETGTTLSAEINSSSKSIGMSSNTNFGNTTPTSTAAPSSSWWMVRMPTLKLMYTPAPPV